MPEITFLGAINQALHQEMAADERVFVIGEDIGILGGAFKATAGLLENFGRRRVIDSPMCEWALVGMANGAGLMGLRPVVEIQSADFISNGFDTIVQFASTTHYRWGAAIPIVIRAPWGGGTSAGPFHSQCPEAWFVHTPGLKVIIPSNPYDAKGLLIASIREPNPVIFFEPKVLYQRQRGEVPEESYTVPIGQAATPRAGDDLTIITYGALVTEAMTAAKALAEEDISCEIVDIRTLAPLDTLSILESAKKTGKVLIVHEAWRSCGIGAEVCALICEQAFEHLAAPPVRLTAPDTPVPYSPPLERAYRPNAEKIIASARKLVAY